VVAEGGGEQGRGENAQVRACCNLSAWHLEAETLQRELRKSVTDRQHCHA